MTNPLPSPREPTRCNSEHLKYSTFFRRVRRIAKKRLLALYVCPSRLSVCPHQKIRLPVKGFFLKFYIEVFFEYLSKKFNIHCNMTRVTGTLHEDQCAYLIISRSVLLRMRNVRDKSCRENQNTFCVDDFFPNIVLFITYCDKIQ